MTNRRTTIAGLIAGLTFIAAALAEDGPWNTARVLRVVVGACISALGVVARDATAEPSRALPPAAVPDAPVTPETSGVHVQPVVEASVAWGPRPSGT